MKTRSLRSSSVGGSYKNRESKTKEWGKKLSQAYILTMRAKGRVGLTVERRHHLQSVCLQDAVLVDQTDENRFGLSLVGQCYSIHLTAQT
ncbi:hypothetical protein AVEN_155990-1 [Araneus ventricosus]|uniref:Uncharacterized protein n=1 Tax=Araneus ventricosus TaxID=182803 RepID=A0A4Y2JK18_ARAVE|nr:hypothetical protein AVEN_155990-1 [Araneus ventricosus]